MPSIEQHWYRSSLTWLTMLLLPFSWLYHLAIVIRKKCYRLGINKILHADVPVIVVGNVTVGGTGKTPFVIWLAEFLKAQGWNPGIVSRGVGGRSQNYPRWVVESDSPTIVGDEAILIAKRTHCPVVIGVDRPAAVQELLVQSQCNIVISDDGLQHTRLGRDLEIVMIDHARRFGNKKLLPAGPLRESLSRLSTVDFVISHPKAEVGEIQMQLFGDELICLMNPEKKKSLDVFKNQKVHAVAAIGNPSRFFTQLKDAGIEVVEHVFPDHYVFDEKDLLFPENLPILMTEKDAVKCQHFTCVNAWYLPISVSMDVGFEKTLLSKLGEDKLLKT